MTTAQIPAGFAIRPERWQQAADRVRELAPECETYWQAWTEVAPILRRFGGRGWSSGTVFCALQRVFDSERERLELDEAWTF